MQTVDMAALVWAGSEAKLFLGGELVNRVKKELSKKYGSSPWNQMQQCTQGPN